MKKKTTNSAKEPENVTNIQPETNSGKTGKVLPEDREILPPLLYAHQNTAYLIDEGKEEEFSFSSLEIYTKGTCIEPTLFKRRIYNRKPLYREFKINITELEREKEDGKGISVSLYQKGVPKPLMQEIIQVKDQDLTINWTHRVKELEPGGYFLWLRGASTLYQRALGKKIGQDVKVDFEILEDGDELPHPEIAQITLKEDRNSPLFNADIKLRDPHFEVTLTQPLDDGNIISACCYDKDLYQMSEGITDGYPVSKAIFKIRLNGSMLWMPGTYDIILLHNQAPFARFSYSINNNEVHLSEVIPVERYDKYYMIGRYLSINEPAWDKLSTSTISAGLRKGIIDNLDSVGFNKIHLPYLGANLYDNINYLIECTDDDENFEMILQFCLLIANTRLVEPYDCREFIDKYNHDRTNADENFKFGEIPLNILKNAGSLLQAGGDFLMSKVIYGLRSRKNSFVFICNKGEGERLFDAYPTLRTYFPASHRLSMFDYSTSAIAYEIRDRTMECGKVMEYGAVSTLANTLIEAEKLGLLAGWNKENIMNYVYDTLLTNFRRRKLEAKLNEPDTAHGHIEAEDIDSVAFAAYKESFEDAMADLNAMIGLGKVKHNFEAVMHTLRMFQLRKNVGLNSTFDMSHHMLFIGNPGTGKTTVARMIGRIFKSLGLLSKGEVIVADRSRLVGQWIGETERKVGEILAQAQGNVLFIDEAYSLCDGSKSSRNDYGYRVIECLMPVLSADNPNMLVIMAGYPKEMDMLMESNSGLKGRFPYRFSFEDYTAEELIMIGKNLLEKNDYELSPEAEQLFCTIVRETVRAKDRNFSNARWVEQFIRNRILPAMAERIVHQHLRADKEYYRTVELVDVQTAHAIEKEKNASPAPRTPIGFSR